MAELLTHTRSLLLCWKPTGGRRMRRGPSKLPKAIRIERLHCSFNKRFTGVSICQTLVRLALIIIQLKLGPKELTIHPPEESSLCSLLRARSVCPAGAGESLPYSKFLLLRSSLRLVCQYKCGRHLAQIPEHQDSVPSLRISPGFLLASLHGRKEGF